jgi:hypothetical protein
MAGSIRAIVAAYLLSQQLISLFETRLLPFLIKAKLCVVSGFGLDPNFLLNLYFKKPKLSKIS